MKTESTVASVQNTVAPYGMQAYAAPGPATNSPIHSMQNMYGNMQLQHSPQQYPMTQQAMSAPQNYAGAPNTMQNVPVVDFKEGLVTQHHIAQMQQQYKNSLNAPVPSLGLVGADGRYMPATAATAAPYGMTGSSIDYSDRFDRSDPRTNSSAPYSSRTAMHPQQLDFDKARARNSVSSSIAADRMHAARMSRMDTTNARVMKNMIDESVRASTAAASLASQNRMDSTNSRAMKDMIDESVRASTAAASAASATSMTNSRAMTDLIDERVRASTAAAAPVPSVTSSRAMKDLIDERVRRGINSMPSPQPAMIQSALPTQTAAAVSVVPTNTTASGFHAKPVQEQRQIVGDAVRSVMKDYNVTPRVASGMQPRPLNTASSFADRSRPPNTQSSFVDRSRAPNTTSVFSERSRIPSSTSSFLNHSRTPQTSSAFADRSRYERHDAF